MPKSKKTEKSLEGKSNTKKKANKKKPSDLSKSNAETEEINNLVIEDEIWQCSVVVLVPQTQNLYDFLLQVLVNLPENFTVVTRDDIPSTKDKGNKNKSRKGSKTRSSSKSSKQSGKSKATKSKNKSKKEEVKDTKPSIESTNNEGDSLKVGLALKKLIVDMRITDIENNSQNITDGKINKLESLMKNKVMKTTASRESADNKTTATEDKLAKYESVLHRFVILLGFYDPLLLEALNKLNVSVKATINIRNIVEDNIESSPNERLSSVTAKTKRKPSVKRKKGSHDKKLSSDYSAFLEKMIVFSSTDEFLERCKDVTFLNYIVKNLSTKNKEIGIKYKIDLLGIFHKIKNAWHKYKSYTESIQVQSVPTANEVLKIDDAKIYSTMISMVPLECISSAVVLHCILEQIVWWSDDQRSSEETIHHSYDDNSNPYNSPSSSKLLIRNRTPILIHLRDEMKYNTFHLDLPEFDFVNMSINLFMKSPVYKLWEQYPPQPKPVRKWFEFQLQKLQKLNDNCVLKLDHFFPIYLHYLLMDVLIFKTNQFTNSNDDTINSSELEKEKVHKIFSSEKEPEVNDKNSDLFIKEILYNILCKVPNFSLSQNYAEVFDLVSGDLVETNQNSLNQPVFKNRLQNKTTYELPVEMLLQKRELHRQGKLNKLVSFLNCSEFVNLYEDLSKLNLWETNRLAKYGFIETLNKQTFCQSVQQAFQTFSNVSYDYFPVSDCILLWFNNSVQDQVISSCSSKSVLETPLGFRDFYCYKLRERTNFGDLIKEEDESRKSFKESDYLFVDELKADLDSQIDNHSEVEVSEKQFRIEPFNPTIAFNLGSLRMESRESFSNFFSVDSSSVQVKRAKYFDNKANIVVNVNKNNTSLRYDLNPESSNNFVQCFVDVQELLNLNCILKWDIISDKSSSIHRSKTENDFETSEDSIFKLNCSLSITLPSGLLIEVVPTNSIYGPFYVRQRYLGKGPNCSSIWDEVYRCYFNNGMVLIFRVDDSVDILYNNGTTVKCHSLELIELDSLHDDKGNKVDKNYQEDPKEAVDGNLNPESTLKSKGLKNQQKKKGKVKADLKTSRSDDGKETNKKKDKSRKGTKIMTENNDELSAGKETEVKIISFEVVKHSVLSWDGNYSQYKTGNLVDMNKCLSLRIAFDIINHELYWQRSDGMSSLLVSGNSTTKFPDGSKTTSFTIDNKEMFVENDFVFIYYASGDLVKVESLVPREPKSMITELSKGNRDSSHLLVADRSSLDDSLGTEFVEGNGFVYVENSFHMEHTNYASVEYFNYESELKLTLPGNCWVIVDKSGRFSFKGNKSERITLFNDSLLFEANVLSDSTLSKSSTTLRFENVNTIPIIFSQTEDSFGNVFSVDERGNTAYLPFVSDVNHEQPHSSLYSARFPQNTERLFVFNRDLTGYEMIHEVEHANYLSNTDVQTVKTPLIKDDNQLYSLYMQSPICITKSENYIVHNVEEVTPSLIKRKDLLKAHETPETIWFYPGISSVKNLPKKNEVDSAQPVKAMLIVQRLKVKKKGLDVVSLFSKSLTKYMEINEQIYQKYLNFHLKETRKEEDLIECEKNRMNFLGSNSYYLTDNLPVVITGGMAEETGPNKDIFKVFTSSVSKILL